MLLNTDSKTVMHLFFLQHLEKQHISINSIKIHILDFNGPNVNKNDVKKRDYQMVQALTKGVITEEPKHLKSQ